MHPFPGVESIGEGQGVHDGNFNTFAWARMNTMLPVDHHVHLERGPYTFEWLDAFVNRARECGISRLGIVEHSTQFRSLDWHMELEISPDTDSIGVAQREWFERHRNRESLAHYIEFVKNARKRHANIAFGLEVDWMGRGNSARVIQGFEWDFVIGSVHFVNGWAADNPELGGIWQKLSDNEVYKAYFVLLRDLVDSHQFDILGHLDVLKMVRPYDFARYRATLTELADAIADAGITVEINTAYSYRHGLRDEFTPSHPILALLAQRKVPFTISSDAHMPEHVGLHLDKALKVLHALGVKSVRRFTRRVGEEIRIDAL